MAASSADVLFFKLLLKTTEVILATCFEIYFKHSSVSGRVIHNYLLLLSSPYIMNTMGQKTGRTATGRKKWSEEMCRDLMLCKRKAVELT